MRSIFTLMFLVIVGQSIAQISSAEYFIDIDPGIENGVTIPIDADFTISESLDIDTDDLEAGFHTLYVRVKDTEEAWSLYDKQSFHVTAPANSYALNEAEYFIDTDPGIGNGEPILITEDFTISESTALSTTGIEPGFHSLYLRVKDGNGKWSGYEEQVFHVSPPAISAEIVAAEYFIDTDPGTGNANQITLTAGFTVDEDFQIDTEALENGFHTLYVRVKDSIDGWTLYDKQSFRIQDSGPIIAAEYFIDTDPGLGNGEEILIQSGFNIYEEPQLATLGLDPGIHDLYVRVMDSDDVWSPADTASFTIVIVDGLSEMSNSSFVIYPNPTADRVHLNTDEYIQQLLVYDGHGRLVKSQNGNRYQIDVSDLPQGNYVLEVVSSDERHHFRFVKD